MKNKKRLSRPMEAYMKKNAIKNLKKGDVVLYRRTWYSALLSRATITGIHVYGITAEEDYIGFSRLAKKVTKHYPEDTL